LRELIEGLCEFARRAGLDLPPPFFSGSVSDQRFLAFVWRKLVEHFEAQGKTFIMALDEFPRLLPESGFWTETERKNYVPMDSFLQRLIDEVFDEKRHMIILSGSSASVMRKIFFAGSAPLYGRATLYFVLRGLSPEETAELFGLDLDNPEHRRFTGEVLTILGGTPYYLRLLRDVLSERDVRGRLDLALSRLLFEDLTLRHEPDLIFQDEPGASEILKAILKVLSVKREVLQEDLAATAGVSNVSPYLSILRLSDVAEPVPLLRSPLRRARKKVPWRVCDPFLRIVGRIDSIWRTAVPEEPTLSERVFTRLREAQGESYEVLCQRVLAIVSAPKEIIFGRFLLHLPDRKTFLEYDGVGFLGEKGETRVSFIAACKLSFSSSDWKELKEKVKLLLERFPPTEDFRLLVFGLKIDEPPEDLPWKVGLFDLPSRKEVEEFLGAPRPRRLSFARIKPPSPP